MVFICDDVCVISLEFHGLLRVMRLLRYTRNDSFASLAVTESSGEAASLRSQ